MPVKVPASLPARSVLDAENVFLMDELRALHQDIRPLRIAILNLMPTKVATETQLLRLLGNTPLQVEVTLLHMASHDSKNTSAEHLLEHYVSFSEVRDQSFDGLIVTSLWTFGFIFLVSQRLAAVAREARDNLELIFNTKGRMPFSSPKCL